MKRRMQRGLAMLATAFVAAAASAGGPLSGSGPVAAKNMHARTVQIAKQVYHVTETTILRDHEGNLVSLEELDVPVRKQLVNAGFADYEGDFEAIEVGGRLVLQSLELVELEGDGG